ncbi:MAG: hypothetical protein LBD46_07625 [Endomicrobium sp.]|jgi:hypothetical protein|nr:hypothetical protein [Endomicrobium sp.]
MKKFFVIVCVLFLSVSPALSASAVHIKPFTTHLSAEDAQIVELAILKACKVCKWTAIKVSDTEIQAHLMVRVHKVSVSIRFDANGYEISYLDSQNMNYNARRNSIHAKYNKWVSKLDKVITTNINLAQIEELENDLHND